MAKSRPARASATNTKPAYCPDSCDIIWLHFDPQVGREQAGRRPAYVLSPRKYNQLTGLCIVCPITSQVKGYPFEVALPPNHKATGVVLADHVKSLSWAGRASEFFTTCPEIAEEIAGKIAALLPK